MQLVYHGKKTNEQILARSPSASVCFSPEFTGQNALILGDNFDVMQLLLNRYGLSGKVDLIYIDPPFATKNVFFAGEGRVSTISPTSRDEVAYDDSLSGERFIEFLRERLVLARALLSPQGSIYLHIDCKIGHYVKVAMDEIFGAKNFHSDITRVKCNPKNFSRKGFGNIKDVILFYTKGDDFIWNEPYDEFTQEDLKRLYKKRSDDGRMYTTVPLHAPGETASGATGGTFKGLKPPTGRHWRVSPAELEKLDAQGLVEWSENGVPRKIIFADESKGKKVQDIWEFKDSPYPSYPTEKNLAMLERIVSTSSLQGSLVLDFFCGSGTTLLAAQKLGRRWLGIDKGKKAIETANTRLKAASDALFDGGGWDVIVMEETESQARAM